MLPAETHLLLPQPSHEGGRGEAEPQPGPIPPTLAQRLLALLAVLQHRAAEDTLHPWPPCQRQAWWGNELRLGRVSFLIKTASNQP